MLEKSSDPIPTFPVHPKKFKSLSAKRIPSGEGREGKKARRSTDYFRL